MRIDRAAVERRMRARLTRQGGADAREGGATASVAVQPLVGPSQPIAAPACPNGHRFTLAYPPSANRYWRMGRGHIHKSQEARAYQQASALRALAAGVRPIAGAVVVSLNVYRPAKRGDLDNTQKVLLDALKGIAYADDKQIVGIVAHRYEDPKNPRVEVEVVEAGLGTKATEEHNHG